MGEQLLEIVTNFGSFGVLAWLVFHVFKTLIPKMQADFSDALREIERDRAATHAEAMALLGKLTDKVDKMTSVVLLQARSSLQRHEVEGLLQRAIQRGRVDGEDTQTIARDLIERAFEDG